MNSRTSRSRIGRPEARAAFISALVLMLAGPVAAAGFTEPPITFYGKVTNNFDGYTLNLEQGELTFTIQPSGGGAPLSFTTQLSAVGGGYSYLLKIPVEKVPAGFTLTAGSIAAPATNATLQRGVSLNGAPAVITLPTPPEGETFTFSESQRGKIQRVDIEVSAPFDDTDTDGVPDWWEVANNFDPTNPFDVTDDSDNDTADLLTEYLEHTSPGTYEYNYRRWANQKGLTGTAYPPTADPDGDGVSNDIEFGVDTNPLESDLETINERLQGSLETVAGRRYLTLTVTKPPLRRTQTRYLVESSTNLSLWGSLEGTNVVTMADLPLLLKVRSSIPQDAPAASTRGFLRLRVVEPP